VPRTGKPNTRLEELRRFAGIKQEQMSLMTGIPLCTYQRLENGKLTNPPIRYLTNCAVALGVPLEEVCELDWINWTRLENGPAAPPRKLVFDRRNEPPARGSLFVPDKR
jgi:transcriptional regulator with XRE-family HTH domain